MTREPSVAARGDSASRVGEVFNAATCGPLKGCLLGLLWCCVAAPCMLVVAAAVHAVVWEVSNGKQEISGLMGGLGVLFGLIGWMALAAAVRRFRAAFAKQSYLRAGRGGLSFCLPGPPTFSSLLFGFKMRHNNLAWNDIQTWYPYKRTINGLPSESAIVVKTIRGEKISIPTFLFRESRATIAKQIAQAAASK